MRHALLLSLFTAPALAHEGGVVHLHPHGGEAVPIGLALVAAAWLAWRTLR